LQNIPHIPVLYKEVIDIFKDINDGIVIDCTMGYGGHTSLILEANPNIQLIAIDQDQTAIDFSTKRVDKFKDRVTIIKGRFSSAIKEILQNVRNEDIKGILADIGVSSLQLDQKERGFSYESDNLDMRMDKTATLMASDVVNSYSLNKLETILKDYGELRNYKKIASFIVNNRPFISAKELSQKTRHLLPRGKKTDPATLLMQAIRIEVNDELGELKKLLKSIEEANLKNTKIAIISFHSLEDRIVKTEFNRCEKEGILKILTKKPITPSEDEIKKNPPSRSAKMRCAEGL